VSGLSEERGGKAMIPPPVIARDLKSQCDFVAIVGRFTRLRRSGRQYVGLCPFHSERHPSFYVRPERKVFYCFGCGVGGDVFRFVMLAEGCDFRRALEIVSGRGVAASSEGRRPSRFAGGVGAKPLAPRSGAPSIARSVRPERLPISIEPPPLSCAADVAYEAERAGRAPLLVNNRITERPAEETGQEGERDS